MSSKPGVNLSELARSSRMARSTLERVLNGKTKNPRAKTLRILQEAGLLPRGAALLIPENVRSFAQALPLRDIERLMNVRLKPVNSMTAEELRHVHDSMKRFPGLYEWNPAQSEGKRQQAHDTP